MTNQGGPVKSACSSTGELVEAASGKRFDNINPATEEVLGEVADASAEDMQRAIDAGRDEPSTRPTGRPTARCASAASSSCRPRSSPSGRTTARRSSPRWARRA